MKKSILTCVLIISSIIFSFSQSNFKKGYIITNKNDTVFGLIDFRTDHTNSLLCKFKYFENVPDTIYKPTDISSYRFIEEGKYYVSRTVEIDKILRTVFLEYLVQGIINLYYLPESNGYYFFENQKGEIISTTKNRDVIVENNKIKQDNRYKGVMSYVFKDYLPLAQETSKAEFDRRSMIEYTKEYHDKICDSGEKCIIFENDYKKKFTKLDFSVYGGFEYNNIKINYDLIPEMYSYSPVVGAVLNISSPRVLKSLSLFFDLNMSGIAGACDYINNNPDSVSYNQYSYNGIKATLNSGFKYTYEKGNFRPSVEAGISKTFFLNMKSVQLTEYPDDSPVSTIENEVLPNQSIVGIMAGVGVDYMIKKNKFIVARLIYSRNNNYYIRNTTIQFKFGYKF